MTWWSGAIGYEIYPRSFADSSGDGVGDLEGIRRHLDHLTWLGVDALWITPFYPNPGFDHGYDVSNYVDVDPIHGTLDDFDRLVADAHARGLRVIVDIVPNHTSHEHEWFRKAIADPSSAYRDYYIWKDPAPNGGPPNNWVSHFGGPAWTQDARSGQYYLHLFLPEQPDLNWENPEVAREFDEILRFWCERGVDGFRIDVAHGLVKDVRFRDNPQIREPTPDMSAGEVFHCYEHRYDLDQNRNIGVFRRWKRVVSEYDAMLLGEIGPDNPARHARYHDAGQALDRNFYLSPVWSSWQPMILRDKLRALEMIGGDSIAWVTDSHDASRSPTRFGGGHRGRYRSLCLTTLMFGLGGMPFLWEGQELALEDGIVAVEDRTDPVSTRNENPAGGRDGARTVMPWDTSHCNGFTTAPEPWMPSQPRPAELTVAVQKADPDSWIHRYRRLIELRKKHPDLHEAPAEWIDGDHGLTMTLRRGRCLVAANLDDHPSHVHLPDGNWSLVFTSRPDGAGVVAGELELDGETAAILLVG